MDFIKLREKHKKLIYETFKVVHEGGDLKVTFNFLLTPDVKFEPTVILPNISRQSLDKVGSKVLENLAFNLGLVELLSYWKAACPAEIVIQAGFLDKEQIKFWKKLLIKGLGEFFYTNHIDFTQSDIINFVIPNPKGEGSSKAGQLIKVEDSSVVPLPRNDIILKDRDLVLVGGGKDSAVTLEKVSSKDREYNCLLLNPTAAAVKISKLGGCKKPIIIERTIDPNLLKLNKEGYLNGHTPFSAYLAFLSAFAGILYDYKNLIVSNEASSNEGNVEWLGEKINHQYSKSFEFEKDFRDYCAKYLSTSANYYSFIRSMGELEVSEKFSKMEKYHKIFLSCNKGSSIGIWCGECPKCVSTYLLLYPFMGEKVNEIFEKDITERESFVKVVGGLMRENNVVKPFECVATVEEIKISISKNPKVMQMLKWKILILGFAREGQAVLDYYQKHFPNIQVDTADQKDGENYLEKLKDYDVIIKSPGIPYLPEIKKAKEAGKIITSATQIFFDLFKGIIIGVTGTKGKSTTSSLIYEVLKTGGVDVYLIGNIGKPALKYLDQLSNDSVVVYELSSFMLEGLDKSPHIAVITNLYPEHLDHHESFEDYVKSKSNIAKYQIEKDYLIYNEDNAEVISIAKTSKAQKIPYGRQEAVNRKGNLLGEHNLLNTIPAILIGGLFNIPQEKISEAIANFKPLPHRLEFVGEFKRVKFYNDSLATIPQATIEALNALGEDVETLIVGGFDRGIDYSVLGEAIAQSQVKNLILFPDTGEKIWDTVKLKIENPQLKIQKFHTSNMKEAVEFAFKHTSPDKIVLLSPASSSFNLFKDYADRGEQFKEAIRYYSQAA